jgi:hypothetical protein
MATSITSVRSGRSVSPLTLLGGLVLASTGIAAEAGRPLNTEDTGLASEATCLVEVWRAFDDGRGRWVAAPACGLGGGLEARLAITQGHGGQSPGAGLSVKWMPEEGRTGDWAFGVNLEHARVRAGEPRSWRNDGNTLTGIIGWTPAKTVSVNLNLGVGRPAGGGRTSAGALALGWVVHPRVEVFNEWGKATGEATTQFVGTRWWLVPERLGLDLTLGRSLPSGKWHQGSFGLGWYMR